MSILTLLLNFPLRSSGVLALFAALTCAASNEPGLLFYLSADHDTVADFSAANTPKPTYESDVTSIADGVRNRALSCGDQQLLAYRAPGNVYAQRGTVAFFWRSRYPVGPTEFPIFRVSYADHSSWDMVFLRIDYNGHGFDAFVTDASLSRTRVSVPMRPFPGPERWTHLAVAWDENKGLRFFINGREVAEAHARARFDAALDQFGTHSRVISPFQVQSDYNFVRGGDIDELRIYDRMLDERQIASLARGDIPANNAIAPRSLFDDPDIRGEWALRYGWSRPDAPPPYYAGEIIGIRKIEIHDAYDLKRWWWKATDGIRETTWPGVYNRSRLPGRNDYFQLPDWDCYVQSGRAITFALPAEPCNHLEISGAAWGKLELLPANTDIETASDAGAESVLFQRTRGPEKSVHSLAVPLVGRKIRFKNEEPEQPIGEIGAYFVSAKPEPVNGVKQVFRLVAPNDHERVPPALQTYLEGRFPREERAALIAIPANTSSDGKSLKPPVSRSVAPASLPIVHLAIPDCWDSSEDGLDGIAIELPPLAVRPTHGEFFPLNIQVHDPLWPLRTMTDFTCSVKPGERKTLWLDLRDRLLPRGRPLWISIAGAGGDFSAESLLGSEIRLVCKSREAARNEHEADRFTQARDAYAMMVEEHPHDPRLDLWNRFKSDLEDLLRVNPDHVLGQLYATAAGLSVAPKGENRLSQPPSGAPEWAYRQVELLGHVKRLVNWYIDHRQVRYGDFGGGISDDDDLTNMWPGVALMGADPEKLSNSVAALLDAADRNGMFTRGLPTIQADELHSYEEGINCLGQNLILRYGSPRVLERAMETTRGIKSITGLNAAGHRHIRTSYYSGVKMAEEEPWGYAKPFSYLVLQIPQLMVDFNGNPATKQFLIEVAQGLLAHHRPGVRGGSAPSVRFSDDREAEVGRGYFPWHVYWAAYRFSGDRSFLRPIFDVGVTSLVNINANVLDLLDLRLDWGARLQGGEDGNPLETRRNERPSRERATNFRSSSGEHFGWQLTGDKSRLEKLYCEQSAVCARLEYINTAGSVWIDRVAVPYADLQRARLGGVALVRNSVFPGHVVSWRFAAPATDQSVAILIPRATQQSFKVLACNLESNPVEATMTGWNIDPGTWEMTQGVDQNADDSADGKVVHQVFSFERSRAVTITLAPRATTVLTFELKQRGRPYWERPDLGIDPEDVQVHENQIDVIVHSLGSVVVPATKLAVRASDGAVIARAEIPALAAPLDLEPRTVSVKLDVPRGTSLVGATVEIDPGHQLEEITRLNNVSKL